MSKKQEILFSSKSSRFVDISSEYNGEMYLNVDNVVTVTCPEDEDYCEVMTNATTVGYEGSTPVVLKVDKLIISEVLAKVK